MIQFCQLSLPFIFLIKQIGEELSHPLTFLIKNLALNEKNLILHSICLGQITIFIL